MDHFIIVVRVFFETRIISEECFCQDFFRSVLVLAWKMAFCGACSSQKFSDSRMSEECTRWNSWKWDRRSWDWWLLPPENQVPIPVYIPGTAWPIGTVPGSLVPTTFPIPVHVPGTTGSILQVPGTSTRYTHTRYTMYVPGIRYDTCMNKYLSPPSVNVSRLQVTSTDWRPDGRFQMVSSDVDWILWWNHWAVHTSTNTVLL